MGGMVMESIAVDYNFSQRMTISIWPPVLSIWLCFGPRTSGSEPLTEKSFLRNAYGLNTIDSIVLSP